MTFCLPCRLIRLVHVFFAVLTAVKNESTLPATVAHVLNTQLAP
jgi:hypothetical protein